MESFEIETADGPVTINAARVRLATFISQRRDVRSTVRTLNKGSTTYKFDTGQSGAVIVTGNYLNWEFIAPSGKFDASTLDALTVGQMFTAIRTGCASVPVDAWDEYAVWLSHEKAATFNALIGDGNSLTIRTKNRSYSGKTTAITPFDDFPGMMDWMERMSPSAFLNSAVTNIIAEGGKYSMQFVVAGATLTLVFRV